MCRRFSRTMRFICLVFLLRPPFPPPCSGLRASVGDSGGRQFKKEFILRHKRAETRWPQARRMSRRERRKKGRVSALAAAAAATRVQSPYLPPCAANSPPCMWPGINNRVFCSASAFNVLVRTGISTGREIHFTTAALSRRHCLWVLQRRACRVPSWL